MKYDFNSIYKKFPIPGDFISCEPYGEGHINETFLLLTKEGNKINKYIHIYFFLRYPSHT